MPDVGDHEHVFDRYLLVEKFDPHAWRFPGRDNRPRAQVFTDAPLSAFPGAFYVGHECAICGVEGYDVGAA
jgi:hypothetical protein